VKGRKEEGGEKRERQSRKKEEKRKKRKGKRVRKRKLLIHMSVYIRHCCESVWNELKPIYFSAVYEYLERRSKYGFIVHCISDAVQHCSFGSAGSVTNLEGPGDSGQRCESIATSGEARPRRSSLFSGTRSFRRTQTTTTNIATAAVDEVETNHQSATLPRRRQRNDSGSRLSAGTSSWASLRRSHTSESLSLMKTQICQLSNGFNLSAASTFLSLSR